MKTFSVEPPAGNDRGPRYLESLIAGWVAMLKKRETVDLGIVCEHGRVRFLFRGPAVHQQTMTGQLLNAYPGASVNPIETNESGSVADERRLRLSPDSVSLKLHSDFVEEHTREPVDPIEGLIEAVKSGRNSDLRCEYWLSLRPARTRHVDNSVWYSRFADASYRFPSVKRCFLRHASGRSIRSRMLRKVTSHAAGKPVRNHEVSKLGHPVFDCQLTTRCVAASSGTESLADRQQERLQAAIAYLPAGPASFITDNHRSSAFLMTAAEAATLWHLPTSAVYVPRLQRSVFRELEAPADLPGGSQYGVTELGRQKFRTEQNQFGIQTDDRRRHLFVCGKTGMGKSTLLQNMIAADIASGRGIALIDPHGDLAEAVLDYIPRHRTNDVIHFDAGDRAHPLAYNPLECHRETERPLVADGVLSAFKKLFGDSWGPRMEDIFRTGCWHYWNSHARHSLT